MIIIKSYYIYFLIMIIIMTIVVRNKNKNIIEDNDSRNIESNDNDYKIVIFEW